MSTNCHKTDLLLLKPIYHLEKFNVTKQTHGQVIIIAITQYTSLHATKPGLANQSEMSIAGARAMSLTQTP